MKKKVDRIVVDVDPELKKEYKICVIQEGKSEKSVATALIKGYVARQKKKGIQ